MGSRRDWARANSTHNRQSIVAMEPPAPAPAPGAPAVVIFECGQRKGQFYLRPDAHISARRARRCFLWQHMTVPLLFDSIHCGRTGVPSHFHQKTLRKLGPNIYSVMRILVPPTCADRFCFSVSVPLPSLALWLHIYIRIRTYSRPDGASIAAPPPWKV